MREVGATQHRGLRPELSRQADAAGGDVHTAGLLNTPILVAEATANPRYALGAQPRRAAQDRHRSSGCTTASTCDKCVPVCPNDANFVYETRPSAIEYDNFELLPERIRRVPGGVLRIVKAHQFAQLRRRLQRVRQLRCLLSRRRRTAAGEAALLRQPGELPAARRRERLLHRVGPRRESRSTARSRPQVATS